MNGSTNHFTKFVIKSWFLNLKHHYYMKYWLWCSIGLWINDLLCILIINNETFVLYIYKENNFVFCLSTIEALWNAKVFLIFFFYHLFSRIFEPLITSNFSTFPRNQIFFPFFLDNLYDRWTFLMFDGWKRFFRLWTCVPHMFTGTLKGLTPEDTFLFFLNKVPFCRLLSFSFLP